MPAKKAKTTAKKTSPKTTAVKSTPTQAAKNPSKRSTLIVAGALGLVIVGLLVMRYKHIFVPATVNGSPIYGWEYMSELNKAAGSQIIDQLVTESLIRQEASKNNIVVTEDDVNSQLTELETQFSASGGLETFLSAQGMTRADLVRRIETNVMVEKLLADQVAVSEDEIDTEYADNAELYTDLEESEARQQIRASLKNQKLQEEVGAWLNSLQAEADINIYVPGLNKVQ